MHGFPLSDCTSINRLLFDCEYCHENFKFYLHINVRRKFHSTKLFKEIKYLSPVYPVGSSTACQRISIFTEDNPATIHMRVPVESLPGYMRVNMWNVCRVLVEPTIIKLHEALVYSSLGYIVEFTKDPTKILFELTNCRHGRFSCYEPCWEEDEFRLYKRNISL